MVQFRAFDSALLSSSTLPKCLIIPFVKENLKKAIQNINFCEIASYCSWQFSAYSNFLATVLVYTISCYRQLFAFLQKFTKMSHYSFDLIKFNEGFARHKMLGNGVTLQQAVSTHSMFIPQQRFSFVLFDAISWDFMLFHAISCCFMLLHAISCYFMPFHAISSYCMLFHAISFYCLLFHAISCYFMLFHVISCYFML